MRKFQMRAGILCGWLLAGFVAAHAEVVPVRHPEGRIRGFLTLSDLEGRVLAIGELAQDANPLHSDRLTATLRLHFNDGSLHDETAEFSQRRNFRLIAYRLVQKGPIFPRQMEMTLDVARGRVEIRSTDRGEATETISERMKLPPDLANGLVTTLLADLDPAAAKSTVSLLAAAPKPRLVHLEISPAGEAPFTIGGSPLAAVRYDLHVEIGGLAGVVAPLVGKQPPDTHIWMVAGKPPGFLKSEGPLFPEGPVWRIQLASPVWPQEPSP